MRDLPAAMCSISTGWVRGVVSRGMQRWLVISLVQFYSKARWNAGCARCAAMGLSRQSALAMTLPADPPLAVSLPAGTA